MTEIEAISKIQWRINTASEIAGRGEDGKTFEDLEMAIQAIEEIQQYRAIGTVEDIQLIFSLCKDLQDVIKQYERIGTIEELQALKENSFFNFESPVVRIDEKNYNKAIDEFAERMKQGDAIEYIGSYVSYEAISKFIDSIAEQLKGEQNG